jgi:hypothetical protein
MTLLTSLASAISKAKLLKLCRAAGYRDLTGKTKRQLVHLLQHKRRQTAISKSKRHGKKKPDKKKTAARKKKRSIRGIPSSALVKRKQLLEYVTEHLSGTVDLKKARHYKLTHLRRVVIASHPMAVFTPLYQQALALDKINPTPAILALIQQVNRMRKQQGHRPVRSRKKRESPGRYYYYLLQQQAKFTSSSPSISSPVITVFSVASHSNPQLVPSSPSMDSLVYH